MSSTTLTPSELGRLAGPLLIGYILNWGLFGVLSMQVYVYYLAFPKDRTIYKALVYGAFLLEATQTFMFTSSAFRTFAIGFGNPDVLDQIDILWFSLPIMSGLVAFLAQTFYAYRITDLAKHNYVSALIMLLSFVQLGGSIANGIDTKKAVLFSHFLRRDALLTAGIWEGGSAACNVLIATAMVYYLYLRDTAPSGKKSNSHSNLFVTKTIRLFVETGVISAILAVITLILTFLPGRPNYYQASISILGKVYANSMMVTFNSRLMIGSSGNGNGANTTGNELQNNIPLSSGSRIMRGSGAGGHGGEIDLSRSMPISGSGILVTREEVSFPPSSSSDSTDLKEKDVKSRGADDDIYDAPFAVSSK